MSKAKTIEDYVKSINNKFPRERFRSLEECIELDSLIKKAMHELVDSCPEDFINHGLPASEIVKQWRKQVKGE